MRVLFVLNYPGYLRYFDSVIAELADRGHALHIVFDAVDKQSEGLKGIPDRVAVTYGATYPKAPRMWAQVTRDLRQLTDYVHYLHPRYADSDYLRDRVAKRLPGPFSALRHVRTLPAPPVDAAGRLLRWLEAALPVEQPLVEFLRESRADVVVASPVLTVGSRQPDVVVAAKALGVPAILGVASWDHLTTKGMLRSPVDRILVWNPTQRDEAVHVHGVPETLVTVTGAQPFDKWFGREPTPHQEFAQRVGLPADRPMILFAGSTRSISSPEAEVKFVRSWIAALRASSDERVRDAGVLVRPHPYGGDALRDADFGDLGPAKVWPRGDVNPVDVDDRRDYHDSLSHAAAVVGINTSAMIEAAIVGRPVFSIETEDFAATQSGTLHYRYLLPENGGFVQVAGSLTEHVLQLAALLRAGNRPDPRIQAFVERFIRPHGLDRAATPLVADAIEEVGADGAAREVRVPPTGARRGLLAAVAGATILRRRAGRARLLRVGVDWTAGQARGEIARGRQPQRIAARLGQLAEDLEAAGAAFAATEQAALKGRKPGRPKAPPEKPSETPPPARAGVGAAPPGSAPSDERRAATLKAQ